MKEMKQAKTAKKPPVAADYLQGESPRQRGLYKRRLVLDWVYRWGHSTAPIIRQVSGQQANGYPKRLTEKALLRATRTASGTPQYYFTLTESGLQEAERHAVVINSYPEIDCYRVNQQQIRHYALAQQATINALDDELIEGYQTERQLGVADTAGKKRPDVVWLRSNGERWALEVELSSKWDRRLDQFVLEIYRALAQRTYQKFYVVTDSAAIRARYEAAFQAPSVDEWKKNDRGHWERTNTVPLPAWVQTRVGFLFIEDI
jgi:hypothetical protein